VVGACSGGVCVTPASHVCVYQNAPIPCPPSFPIETTVYQGFHDGRVCSQCTCSVLANPTCEATLTTYSDGMCLQS
jgi:hypothetical protein